MTTLLPSAILRTGCWMPSAWTPDTPVLSTTVRRTEASAPPSLVFALITASPTLSKVTKPPFTVATLSLSLVQIIRLSVVFFGEIAGFNATFFSSKPTVSSASSNVNERAISGSFCLSLRYKKGSSNVFEV